MPDIFVDIFDGNVEIAINEANSLNFGLNEYYASLIKTTPDPETREYLIKKLNQAKWIQSCIENRTKTLKNVL